LVHAVTFDFGQTLAELDHQMLAARCAERDVAVDPARLEAETSAAWDAYGDAKRRGLAGRDAWCTFMVTLLSRAGAARSGELAEWLFTEQPAKNLWRKPVPGMAELAAEVATAGAAVGIVSNSEGRLAELVAALGWAALFPVVADSGKLGIEKPDVRIFAWAAERLKVPLSALVHIGDAWDADVVGALDAGARAVWFAPTDTRELPAEVRAARTAREARAALRAFGVL
jgi:putative hydrolase of the HAD superfamily